MSLLPPVPVPLLLRLPHLLPVPLELQDVQATGNLLLDLMPLMFIPSAVGLIEKFDELKAILVPFFVITVVSTLAVMTVTGKSAEWIIRRQKKEEN